jgi:hypothetical protein
MKRFTAYEALVDISGPPSTLDGRNKHRLPAAVILAVAYGHAGITKGCPGEANHQDVVRRRTNSKPGQASFKSANEIRRVRCLSHAVLMDVGCNQHNPNNPPLKTLLVPLIPPEAGTGRSGRGRGFEKF